MKKLLLFVFLGFYSFTFSQVSHQELGKQFINDLLVDKNPEKSFSYFDNKLKSMVTISKLLEINETLEKQIGAFKSILETNSIEETYYYYCEFEKTKLDIKLAFNDKNEMTGLLFTPHKDFKTETRLGKELDVKSSGIILKGTLLLPEKDNLKKLVIFVHGSGPNDRDEKVNDNKPFQDIAESLYKQGIASYRFDKRTLSNPETFNEKSTIDDEVTNDVVNIVSYFKNEPQFSGYQIIVLGHSLGANLMPRIANKSNQIDKIIMLAGNSRPMQDLIVEQYNYLYSLNPTDEFKAEVEKIETQVRFLNSKAFNLESPSEKLPLRLPAYYWKSALDYNPIKEVQKVKIPILILQGERDYQVTMADFNLWKKTLKNNKKASFVSYPKLNHLFIAGEGKPNPTEYTIKGKVENKVITDIFEFITK